MASLVLGAVGGFMFGPIGFLGGSLLGNLLFPAKQEGPRLQNLKLQNSEYGKMIPIPYGVIRISGQVVWQTDLQDHKHTSGGKGGPEVTTLTYTASFAVKICKGPIAGILTMWANGEVVYDTSGNFPNVDNGAVPLTLYLGVEDAVPDPTMEAVLGVGNVPAFRDDAAVVFTDWDLGRYGNTLPNLSFLVNVKGGADTPITRVAEYHDEPHNDYGQERWGFRSFGGAGAIGSAWPAITHWKLDGSDIRILQINSSVVFTYSNPSLIADGTDTAGPDDHYPDVVEIVGGGDWFEPCGTYVYADLTLTDIWRFVGSAGFQQVGATTTSVGAGTVGFSGGGTSFPPITSNNFAFNAGVTVGEYVIAVILTQDGTACFVLTGALPAPHFASKWYRIVNGVVDLSGTCSAFAEVSGRANNNIGTPKTVAVFENDRTTCWVFSPVVDGTHSGTMTIWKISGSVFAPDSFAGSCSALAINYSRTGIPNSSGPLWTSSIYIPAPGYCGVNLSTSLVLFSRFAGVSPTFLYEIVGDLSNRVGLAGSDYDVTDLTQVVDGFMITTRADARTDIDPLRAAYYFDAVEQSGKAVFINRGRQPILTIADNDLAAQQPVETPPPLVEVDRAQEIDLPVSVNVTYIAKDAAYQNSSQQAIRQTVLAQSVADVQLPIAMTDLKGRQIANVNLYEAWTERTSFKFRCSRKYLYLEPTDVVTVHGYVMRIDKKTATVPGIVEFEAKQSNPAIYIVGLTANATSGAQQPSNTAAQPTNLVLLDIPLLQDTDFSQGIYAAAAGTVDQTWRGYTLYKSSDDGSTYSQVGASSVANTMGVVTAALPDYGGGNTVDEINQFQVTVGVGGGTLAGVDLLTMLNGANTALVGQEILQFRDATLTAPRVYTCAGLLRGRRGTEFAMGNHNPSEPFILLPALNVGTPFSDLGQLRAYKGVSNGSTLAATNEHDLMDTGAALRCYSPVQVYGSADGSGNVTINWVRRTRIGGAWLDFTDVPMAEPSELYVLQVWNSTFSVCARVVTGITSPTFLYTVAMWTADFGSQQQHVYITVGEIGAYGLGVQTQATIDGGGGSDTAPLNPVQPYNTAPPTSPPVTGCTGTVINDTITWGLSDSKTSPADFGPGQTWVIKIHVPGSPNAGAGRVSGAEFNGPPTNRNAVLSLYPCGAPLFPSAQASNVLQFTFPFWVGAGNPHPQTVATLLPNSDYYVSITNTDTVSEMIFYFVSKG